MKAMVEMLVVDDRCDCEAGRVLVMSRARCVWKVFVFVIDLVEKNDFKSLHDNGKNKACAE